ncbi:MAG: hypothetical protein KKA73_10155 [Chloroflexi bacterium]|nr:hypothetical protein [Chloroflexota bacterium]MBU1748039.1 hypothetical protein [Chloroflexota bacterium]MBU1877543.1 hypothetical protein [Chloroflexota bacterium]
MSTKKVLFTILATSAVLLASVVAPIIAAREDLWRADWPAAAASRLSTQAKISTDSPSDCHHYRAAVAYNWNHNEYLVVWHRTCDDGTRAVYARRMSTSGQPLAGPFLVCYRRSDNVLDLLDRQPGGKHYIHWP